MKPTAGSAKPRRRASHRPPPGPPAGPPSGHAKTQLNLQRQPQRKPEGDLDDQHKSTFWKWVGWVALLHLIALSIFYIVYEFTPPPPPPAQFISLVPQGDIVKGTPGAQQAHKVGTTTPAAVHHSAPPTPASQKPVVQKTPPPKPLTPPVALRPDATQLAAETPPPKVPPKPPKPKPPKVKVDLTLNDGPASPDAPKPKHHPKKPVAKAADEDDADANDHDSTGLSKEEIAAKLGEKHDNEGVKNAERTGTSGSANGHSNNFSDFYAMIRDQVISLWQPPGATDQNNSLPIVAFHVEKDGRVPSESVHLAHSSGNPTIDENALEAVRNLGYLHEPLPPGCPPDMTINFKFD
jgi:TonB family protein